MYVIVCSYHDSKHYNIVYNSYYYDCTSSSSHLPVVSEDEPSILVIALSLISVDLSSQKGGHVSMQPVMAVRACAKKGRRL